MAKVESKSLETEVVIFPVEFGLNNPETASVKEPATVLGVDLKRKRDNDKIRFARLKKSLRKRSANII